MNRQIAPGYGAQSVARRASLDAIAVTEDTLSYQATMTIGGKTVRTYGAWMLKEGKIWRQVTGLLG